MTHGRANLLLVISAILWGAGNVAQQTVLQHIGPLTANGLRCLIACIVVLPFCFRSITHLRGLDASGKMLLAVTALSFSVASTFMQIGYGLTSVMNAGFLVNTATVLTPLVAWLILRQRPASITIPASAMCFLGACMMGGGSLSTLSVGDTLCLVSAVFYAIWMISLGEFVKRYGRAEMVTVMQFGLTAILCLALAGAGEQLRMPGILAAWPELIMLGVLSTGLAYLLQAIAQKSTSASEAAVIVSAEAVFGALAAAVLLGESLDATRAGGAVLICLGILTVQLQPAFASKVAP
jgi:drug/metabolite transporter (DMT)-like permease